MNEPSVVVSLDVARRSILTADDYRLVAGDEELIAYLLDGQNFSYSIAASGALTWGAFGETFATLGDLRRIALAHPAPPPASAEPDALPTIDEPETVGLELFANMLDTIAFLRVRIRALADLMIEAGVISGTELLGKYATYHERSFEAFRDQMLLRPDLFERRFATWLATEKDLSIRPSDEVTDTSE